MCALCVWFPRSATTINTRRRRQRASAQTESRCPPEFLFDILPSSGFARPVTVTGAVLDFSAEEHPATASAVEETKKKKKKRKRERKEEGETKKKGESACYYSLTRSTTNREKKKKIYYRARSSPPNFLPTTPYNSHNRFIDIREMDKRKIPQGSPTPDGEDRARKRRKQSVSLLSSFPLRWGCAVVVWWGFLVRWGEGERERDIGRSKLCLNVLACVWLWYP